MHIRRLEAANADLQLQAAAAERRERQAAVEAQHYRRQAAWVKIAAIMLPLGMLLQMALKN